ncbi:MAG: phosphate ABC transporter substrate-binding protein [Bacteroidota bacterium]
MLTRLLFLTFLFTPFVGLTQTFDIKGSDTMYPLARELADAYMSENAGTTILVQGGGSSTGIRAMKKAQVGIALVSRQLQAKEKEEIPTVKHQVVAYDALSIIVHPSNQVSELSIEQIKDIFTGKITNWKEVGGRDEAIIVCTRDEDSGTYGFMQENIMKGEGFRASAHTSPSNSGVVQYVSKQSAAIGYVGLAYAEDIIKTVAVKEGNKPAVMPTFRNAMERKYPITRPLSFYYMPSRAAQVKKFIDFVMSSEGQRLTAYEGYIPAKF